MHQSGVNSQRDVYNLCLQVLWLASTNSEIEKLNFCKPVRGNYPIARPSTTFWMFRVKVECNPGKSADNLTNK